MIRSTMASARVGSAIRSCQRSTGIYEVRHVIENFFCKLKQFCAIASRYDKTARNFLAAVHLAAATICLN